MGDLFSYSLRLNHHSKGDHTDTGISFEGAVLGFGKSVVTDTEICGKFTLQRQKYSAARITLFPVLHAGQKNLLTRRVTFVKPQCLQQQISRMSIQWQHCPIH